MATRAATTTEMMEMAKEPIKSPVFFFLYSFHHHRRFFFGITERLLAIRENPFEEASLEQFTSSLPLLFPHTHVYKILPRYSHIPMSYTMIPE